MQGDTGAVVRKRRGALILPHSKLEGVANILIIMR